MENLELTPIQQFYSNSKIFITGATGFIGRILLEKLLRSCPNISVIYILVRQKRGRNPKERLKDILEDVIFQPLKEQYPNFGDKVVGICGDCELTNLGLSSQDLEMLKEQVNIIFHLAATVNFTENLKIATLINVRATKDVLNLASQMPNLKVLMHASTAYANCIRKVTEEKIYPPAFDGDVLISMAENLPDGIFDKISDTLFGEFPNSYTYTKQIAESIVKEFGSDLPVGIHRPACVASTYKEPIQSWVNNKYAVTGVTAYAGLGALRIMHGCGSCKSNIVPADMCINSVIAAAWEVGTTWERHREKFEIPVYNYESNSDKPVEWEYFVRKSLEYGSEIPPSKAVWLENFNITSNLFMYNIWKVLYHILPAFILDLLLVCSGKSPRMLDMYSKLHKAVTVMFYFSTRDWAYKSVNFRSLLNKMSNADKKIFFFDLQLLDWDNYLKTHFYGIRLYVLKDPEETIPEARKRWRRFYWIHQVLTVGFKLCLLWVLWYVLKSKMYI